MVAKKSVAKSTATNTAKSKATGNAAVKQLRAFGLAYPETHTKSPWPGHMDLAVRGKTFAYLSVEGEPLKISCKLPLSSEMALMFPFAKPTPYGLGKAGWVTAEFAAADKPPLGLLQVWIDESYRAQAPKKLLAALDAVEDSASEARTPRAATKKSATKTSNSKKKAAPRKA